MKRSIALACAGLLLSAGAAKAQTTLIRDGLVLSMADGWSPRPDTDILIENGVISAVGADLAAPADARIIDAAGQVVMPGFVNAHDHLSITQQRGLYADTPQSKFFTVATRLGPLYAPDDTYTAFLTGAVEALDAGFTTTADFFDNAIDPRHADAAVRALGEAGGRARLYYGSPTKTPSAPVDLDDLARLDAALPDDGLVQVGLAWRLPADLNDAAVWAVKAREWAFAAERDMPVQVHVSSQTSGGALPMFERLIADGRLNPRLTVIHGTDATPEQLSALNEAGGGLVITPLTEHRVGYGVTRLDRFRSVRRLGIGVDGPALAGVADPFATLRLLALTEIAATHDETSVSPRDLLQMATLGGARALGMEDRIGSLEPGKAADILILSPTSLGLAGALPSDPSALIVYSARPSDIRTVMVAGRVVKQDGRLIDHDAAALATAARRSIEGILSREAAQSR